MNPLTSEEWHKEKYGDPQKCYDSNLNSDHKNSRVSPELSVEIIHRNFNKLSEKNRNHWINKWKQLVEIFPFKNSKKILDVGSPGHGDSILLKLLPNIEKIVCVDGDLESIKIFKPYLDSWIIPIYQNFYEGLPIVLNEKFDTLIQIDLPEHLPDNLYIDITKWGIEHLNEDGKIFIYTPNYPNCIDQIEHISVKSFDFFHQVFEDLGFDCKNLSNSKSRLYLIVERRIDIYR